MAPSACRMGSLPAPLYRPRAINRQQWRAIWRIIRDDSRFQALRDCERRGITLALLALHTSRDFRTSLIDPDLPRLAKAAHMKVTCLRAALANLWALGYLEIIPRKEFHPQAQPPGWRGRGKWLQITNAYEPTLPD